MSRNKLILVSLAGMFMLAQSLYAQKRVGTYSIAFNGYCDGATVTIAASGFVSGTHDNYDCYGSQTWLDGVNGLVTSKWDSLEAIGPVALADNIGVLALDNSALTLYLNFNNNTWGYYIESDGVLPESLFNSGTFTIVSKTPASASGRASWQVPSARIAAPPFTVSGYPTGTYDIVFYDATRTTEYCDFLQLTAQGDRVGGVHNLMTGCGLANAPIGGSYVFLNNNVVVTNGALGSPVGVQGRSLLTTDNSDEIDFGDDITINFYLDFQASAWSVYGTDGTTGLQLINWGFFKIITDNPLSGKSVTHPVGGIPTTSPLHH